MRRFLGWLAVTAVVIIFWQVLICTVFYALLYCMMCGQPITALFKFYRDGKYETALGNERVAAR